MKTPLAALILVAASLSAAAVQAEPLSIKGVEIGMTYKQVRAKLPDCASGPGMCLSRAVPYGGVVADGVVVQFDTQGRVGSISVNLESVHRHTIREALLAKYGGPTSTETEPEANRTVLVWGSRDSVALRFFEAFGRGGRTMVSLAGAKYIDEMSREQEAAAKKNAAGL